MRFAGKFFSAPSGRVLRRLTALAAAGCAAMLIGPVHADDGGLALLDSLQKGSWEVRFRDGSPPRRLCVRTGRELLQLYQNSPNCGRYSVDGTANSVTVQYSCRTEGYARTTVRKETGTLVQIEGQGVSRGRPFQFTAEARRMGAC